MSRKPTPKTKTAAKAAPKPASPRAPKAAAAKSVKASEQAVDSALVREIADMLASTDLTEIEVEKGDLRIRVSRHAAPQAAAAAPSPVSVSVSAPAAVTAAPVVAAEHPGTLKSPMVGTVYRRSGPEAKPFVEIGSPVRSGDKVLLVEAMKTFNEIVAHRTGMISAILIEDGEPVEYDQPLLVID